MNSTAVTSSPRRRLSRQRSPIPSGSCWVGTTYVEIPGHRSRRAQFPPYGVRHDTHRHEDLGGAALTGLQQQGRAAEFRTQSGPTAWIPLPAPSALPASISLVSARNWQILKLHTVQVLHAQIPVSPSLFHFQVRAIWLAVFTAGDTGRVAHHRWTLHWARAVVPELRVRRLLQGEAFVRDCQRSHKTCTLK